VRSSIENAFIKSFSSFGLIKFENGDGEKFSPESSVIKQTLEMLRLPIARHRERMSVPVENDIFRDNPK
jgi:hypothetical protein